MQASTSPFDPVRIGPLNLRNRFIKSGANEAMCMNGVPTRALVRHHSDLALGGVGIYLARVYKDVVGWPLYVVDEHASSYRRPFDGA